MKHTKIAKKEQQDFGPADNQVRDDLLTRFQCFEAIEHRPAHMRERYPQLHALLDICGIGLCTAPLIIAEPGEVTRFRCARHVDAYAGLTVRVTLR